MAVETAEQRGQPTIGGPTLTLMVLSELNNVWRGQGLTLSGDDVVAVWPSGDSEGQGLDAGILGGAQPLETRKTRDRNAQNSWRNVGQQTAILFAGRQHFDETTGSLEVCLRLANRGRTTLGVPIELKVEGINSPLGEVSITDSSNGLTGVGAVWDITSAVTGDRIPPGSASNVFCPIFRLRLSDKATVASEADELVVLELKVLAPDRPSAH
jgi:hypothetical protein